MSKPVDSLNNFRSVFFSNIVDKLNRKYMNNESGTTWYPFSFMDNTITQEILLFGTHPIWTSEEDGYPYRDDKELEGEDFENAVMSICEEEYGEVLNNLYGAYAMVHNRNFAPKEEVEVGDEDDLVITYYRKEGQLLNENDKGVRIYHTKHKLYAACHKYDKRFQNKLGAMQELKEGLKKRGLK